MVVVDRYVVVEQCEDWEQGLGLRTGGNLPAGGVLEWASDTRNVVAMFRTRSAARAAINRTHHYSKAFGLPDMPQRENCKVVRCREVEG